MYDISECGLKSVPAGVFSKCKVLRKEALLLQSNELTLLSGGGNVADMAEVLQVLDLHANHLEKLPEEIGMLKQLRVSLKGYGEKAACAPLLAAVMHRTSSHMGGRGVL